METAISSKNTLYLAALADNDWDFSEPEKATIDDIAARCPQEAGNAVYIARFLQENYRMPDWNMDCAFVGERKSGSAAKISGFTIFPNPAKTEVHVELEQPAAAGCLITVFNLTGQILVANPIPEGSVLVTLPVTNFANGCYFVKISENGRQTYQQKLSIIR